MNVEPNGSLATVTGAIRQAAQVTGADFKYLLATARVESKLDANAQAPTSSARGLFQFIEQTWLGTLKQQGPALGYAPYADAIEQLPSGHYAVTNPRLHSRIMELRSDPSANALMAGAYTRVNSAALASRLGRNPSEGELYLAHFLGPNGASRMIAMAEARPQTPAADMFPGASNANRSIFFDRRGHARGVGDVYRLLTGRYDVARGRPANEIAAAPAGNGKSGEAFAADPAQLAQAYAAAERISAAKAAAADAGPMFHGLFRNGARREAVAPVVSALWGTPKPATPKVLDAQPGAAEPIAADPGRTEDRAADRAAPPDRSQGGFGLFQDRLPDARTLFRGRV